MKLSKDEVLVLVTLPKDLVFWDVQYPKSGHVESSDWERREEVAFGALMGFLWGEGDGRLAYKEPSSKWLVVKVKKEWVVEQNGFVEFKCGKVIYTSSKQKAPELILKHRPQAIVVGAMVSSKNARVGDFGTARSYRRGGSAIAGRGGEALVGVEGKAVAGKHGKAIAGERGTAIVGLFGTAEAGQYGKVSGGLGATITLAYMDTESKSLKKVTGLIKRGPPPSYKLDLRPNVLYRLNAQHEFEETE